ncbi:MAG TPA: hypothetical protein VKE40_14445 [Gemmataceae bacterium]|nr:hypothetical protein [Gemmataceae bacterium]
MDGGEAVVGLFSAAVGLTYWFLWVAAAGETTLLVRPGLRLAVLALAFLGAIAIVWATLLIAADPAVRDNSWYIVLFLVVAWLSLAVVTAAGAILGLSALDDAVRKPNPAAVCGIAGLWLGTALCVAGANVGRGDTIGTTLGPLAMAVGAFLVLWGILNAATGILTSVTSDRDVGAGIGLFGLSLAWGLILGRAVAGDWESTARTLEDFGHDGWPVVALLPIAILVERILRPAGSSIGTAVLVAGAYVAAAAGWVIWLGRP